MHDDGLCLVVREGIRSDNPAILRLQRRWVDEGITHGLTADDELSIEAKLGPFLRVAEVDGRVVGFVAGSVRVSHGLAASAGFSTSMSRTGSRAGTFKCLGSCNS